MPDSAAAPSPVPAARPVPPADLVTQALGWLVAFGTMTVAAGVTSGLTEPLDREWTALIVIVLGLWSAWLFWQVSRNDHSVPGNLAHVAPAGAVLVLLGHLVSAPAVRPDGRGLVLLRNSDTTLLMQLMTLSLTVLLVQDVLVRLRHLRWVLTALGLAAAAGAALRLNLASHGSAESVAMAGCAGVGMMLSPCWLPRPAHAEGASPWRRVWAVEQVARVVLGALLLLWIVLSDRAGMAAGMVACAVTGAMLLVCAAFLRHHRVSLLVVGAILAAGGAVALLRAGWYWPTWLGLVRPLGLGGATGSESAAKAPGALVLGMSSGWVGLGALAVGLAAAVVWGLWLSRGASRGDQARAAVWGCVMAVSAAGLMMRGGLAVPSVAAVAAATWALMPHVMAHRVRRFRGWLALAAFAAVLLVLGLEQRLAGSPWIRPLLREGDWALHAGFAFLLAAVVFWQVCPWRWWAVLLTAAIAGGLAASGELLQKYLSTRRAQVSDVLADLTGAGAALGVLVVIRALQRLQRILPRRPQVSYERHASWRAD